MYAKKGFFWSSSHAFFNPKRISKKKKKKERCGLWEGLARYTHPFSRHRGILHTEYAFIIRSPLSIASIRGHSPEKSKLVATIRAGQLVAEEANAEALLEEAVNKATYQTRLLS